MKTYNVDEAFKLLKEYKITTHKESVRRWLREGKIKGISPKTRKDGWSIKQRDLFNFIHSRLPNAVTWKTNETIVVNESDREQVREEMWWELVRKNIFEDFIQVKKSHVRECVEHKKYSKEFFDYIWEIISQHKQGYATPRINYLLEAFQFEGNRILMDHNYEVIEDKIIYALIEHLRKERINK